MFPKWLIAGFTIVPDFLYVAMSFFATIMVLLILFMLVYTWVKNHQTVKNSKANQLVDTLIEKAIFFGEDEECHTDELFYKCLTLIPDIQYRKLFKAAILSAKKNISGISSEGLRQMYLNLDLVKYALQMVNDRRWYIKAEGIQELATMEMREHIDKILSYADDHNDIVRIEAQTAIVQLQGYKGLLFLDIVTYPITDWQQIKLLKELSYLPEINNFSGIENWFSSANYSVTVFAMRIARNYHLFHLHDHILACLYHENPIVRIEAIHTLREVYTEDTADVLKSIFTQETLKHQIAIIKTLQTIGTDDDIDFLHHHLNCENHELKLSLLRTIAFISNNKMKTLELFSDSIEYPFAEMIAQIKGENV
jgi:hypothetical protein